MQRIRQTLYQNSKIFRAAEETIAESVAQGNIVKGIIYGTTKGTNLANDVIVFVVTTATGIVIGYHY
jgi:hypothetical protein